MAKLADAADLKSAGLKRLWGFKSPSRHHSICASLRSGIRLDNGHTADQHSKANSSRIAETKSVTAPNPIGHSYNSRRLTPARRQRSAADDACFRERVCENR